MESTHWKHLAEWEREREQIGNKFNAQSWRPWAAMIAVYGLLPGFLIYQTTRERTFLDEQHAQNHNTKGYMGMTRSGPEEMPVPRVGYISQKHVLGVMGMEDRAWRHYNPTEAATSKLGYGVTGSSMWRDHNVDNVTGAKNAYWSSSGSLFGKRWKLGKPRKWEVGDPFSAASDEF